MILSKQTIRRFYTASIVLLTPKRMVHTHQQQQSLPNTMSGSCHQQPSSSSSTLLRSSVSEQASAAFSNNPSMVSQYIEQTPRKVPGYHALQSMTQILLEESIDSQSAAPATILVVGAGGGMEMSQFGTAHPNDWSLVGIDPSLDMLELARQMTSSLSNVTFYQGYVTDPNVPKGPYDGATCLLTLHFLPKSQRLDTLRTIYDLLKPGAPLIVAHHSMETMNAQQDEPTQPSSSTSTSSMVSINPWLQRYAAYTAAHSVNGAMSLEEALHGAQTIQERLPYLSPQQDEELLQQAGFHNIQQFYMAFTFRGWVAYKPPPKQRLNQQP